jgi:hypothetical protein
MTINLRLAELALGVWTDARVRLHYQSFLRMGARCKFLSPTITIINAVTDVSLWYIFPKDGGNTIEARCDHFLRA